MACLSLVIPSAGGGRADTVQARGVGKFAQPSTDVDALEVAGITRGQDLGKGAGVQFVLEATDGVVSGLLSIGDQS
jgi:hypothetical protein